jgi:hypothetical protein
LDRYHTGLQTLGNFLIDLFTIASHTIFFLFLGAETIADVWLYTDETMVDKNLNVINENTDVSRSTDSQLQRNSISPHFNNGPSIETVVKNGPVIKEEPIDYEEMEINNDFESFAPVVDKSMDFQSMELLMSIYSEHSYSDDIYRPFKHIEIKKRAEDIVICRLKDIADLNLLSKAYDAFRLDNVIGSIDLEKMIDSNKTLIENISYEDHNLNRLHIMINVANINNILIEEFSKEIATMFHTTVDQSYSTIRKQINIMKQCVLTNEMLSMIITSPGFFLNGNDINLVRKSIDDNILSVGKELLNLFEKLFHDSFKIVDVRMIVVMLLIRMPMNDALANIEGYKRIFPYAVENADSFFALNIVKRRLFLVGINIYRFCYRFAVKRLK